MVCLEAYLLKNFCADAALLFLCGQWRARRSRPGRILAGALVGSAGAGCTALLGGWASGPAAQTALAAAMVYTAFAPVSFRELFSFTATLLLCGAVSVGMMEVNLPPLLGGMAAGFGVCALSKRLKCPPAEKRQVRIVECGQVLSIPAMVDTGNLARDPKTGLPVLVVPYESEAVLGKSRGTLRIRTVAGEISPPPFLPSKHLGGGKEGRGCGSGSPAGNAGICDSSRCFGAGRKERMGA